MHRWEWMKEKERRDEVKTAAIALFNKNLKCFILCWTLALSISIINIFLHAFAFNFLYNLSKNWTKSERSWRTLALFALGARFKLYMHTHTFTNLFRSFATFASLLPLFTHFYSVVTKISNVLFCCTFNKYITPFMYGAADCEKKEWKEKKTFIFGFFILLSVQCLPAFFCSLHTTVFSQ